MAAAIIPFPAKGANKEEWRLEHNIAVHRRFIDRHLKQIDMLNYFVKASEEYIAKDQAALAALAAQKRKQPKSGRV